MTENTTPQAPAGLFGEGQTALSFIPQDGDKNAAARGPLREFGFVRPDGFIEYIGSRPGMGSAIAASVENGDPRVYVSRFRGDSQWWMLAPENTIPDSIPADFQ